MREQTFVILGGGTAGWMAANLLQHHWGHKGVQVQVIDTTQVGTIGDYIVAHYRMSRRDDNDYWRDNPGHDHLSDSLKAVLECWLGGGDLKQEIKCQGIGKYYSTSSWHCLLGGLGHFPRARHPVEKLSPQRIDMSELEDFFSRCALNFPDHREALAKLAT